MIRLSQDLSDAAYHGSPGVTFHRLREFLDLGPAWYAGRYITQTIPAPAQKEWGSLGQAYHIYGLEGEQAFRERVITHPATYQGKESAKKDAPMIDKPWNWNATACQEWREANNGRLILSPDDFAAAVAIGRNMRSNQNASRLLRCGWPELTVEQTDERFPVPVKGRLDWVASTTPKTSDAFAIADPKGTCELERFEREVFKFGYHRQMAYYRKLWRDETGQQLPVYLIAVEKDGMHRVRVHNLEPDLLDRAEQQNERDLDRLAESYAKNAWPLDHDDGMRVIATPAWMTATDNQPPPEAAPWE